MFEQEILSVIQFYSDSTPSYYFIAKFGAGFLGLLCFLIIVGMVATTSYKKSSPSILFPTIMMFVSLMYLFTYERPNLPVFYGDAIQEKIKDKDGLFNYNECLFSQKDYKIAERMGRETYAKLKSEKIQSNIQKKRTNVSICDGI